MCKPPVQLVVLNCFDVATGLEGGSRFAGAKRFALRDLGNGLLDGKVDN